MKSRQQKITIKEYNEAMIEYAIKNAPDAQNDPVEAIKPKRPTTTPPKKKRRLKQRK